MSKPCALTAAGLLLALASLQGHAGSSEELLKLLASKLSEIRASTSNERVALDPIVDVEALHGVSRQAVLSAMGRPDNCVKDAECSDLVNWSYSFLHLPKGFRGGGPELMLFFGKSSAVKEAKWHFSR